MWFQGYAAIFDVPDRGGDVVRAGAFLPVPAVPLLWEHRGAPIGVIERLAEDAQGLRVEGVLGASAADAVRGGRVGGLSFGFRVRAARRGTYRELIAVELVEVSLVRTPMQPGARISFNEGEFHG